MVAFLIKFDREANMTLSARQIIDSFEQLPASEKQRVAFEILRRSAQFHVPSLTDEELIGAAEDLFLTLDAREAESDPSKPGRGLLS
jgi:hypothetical protein